MLDHPTIFKDLVPAIKSVPFNFKLAKPSAPIKGRPQVIGAVRSLFSTGIRPYNLGSILYRYKKGAVTLWVLCGTQLMLQSTVIAAGQLRNLKGFFLFKPRNRGWFIFQTVNHRFSIFGATMRYCLLSSRRARFIFLYVALRRSDCQ